MQNNLQTRLIVTFISLAIVPLVLVGFILAWRIFTTQTRQALELEHEVAYRISTKVADLMHEQEDDLRLLMEMQRIEPLDQSYQAALLSTLLTHQDFYENLILVDSQGEEKIHLSRLEVMSSESPTNWLNTKAFKTVEQKRKTYYSEIKYHLYTGEPIMTIAIPIINLRSGQFIGVLIADFRFKAIWNLIESAESSKSRNIYVVNDQNRVIAHHDISIVLQETYFKVPSEDKFQQGLSGKDAAVAVSPIQLGEQTLYVIAERPASEVLVLALSSIYIVIIVIVIALILASVLGVIATRQIVRPIELLATTAQAISAGDLSKQAEINSQDEIGTLAKAFNSMTTQLRETLEGLEDKVMQRTKALEEAQERLVRQEKLAVLGQLAGGVGHELRNPLGVITNAVYFLQMTSAEADDTTKEYLDIIANRVKESEKIVSDLLNFARPSTISKNKTNIATVVTEALTRHPPSEGINIDNKLPTDLPLVLIDTQQIRQVLVNLITNAYQAMSDKGTLTISAELKQKTIYLTITDTGKGIEAENITKIFEPLFTTKAKGIGLGLAISKNLMELNGGNLTVKSTIGQGTSFTLTLPIMEV